MRHIPVQGQVLLLYETSNIYTSLIAYNTKILKT